MKCVCKLENDKRLNSKQSIILTDELTFVKMRSDRTDKNQGTKDVRKERFSLIRLLLFFFLNHDTVESNSYIILCNGTSEIVTLRCPNQ